MSTRIRQAFMATLRHIGVKTIRCRSSLEIPFLCHVHDFSSASAYINHKDPHQTIRVMGRWCRRHSAPLVYDVGANVGFVCTHLAQMVNNSGLRIIAFEPVWSTFEKLRASIDAFNLGSQICPISAAVSDEAGVCSIAYNPSESLFAQVRCGALNTRVGAHIANCPIITLDAVTRSLKEHPVLIKVDVEGFEGHVLRGARELIRGQSPPAICLEVNAMTLKELDSNVAAIARELLGYRFYYIDDFEGQRIPAGTEIDDLSALPGVCNLFALPAKAVEGNRALVSELFKG